MVCVNLSSVSLTVVNRFTDTSRPEMMDFQFVNAENYLEDESSASTRSISLNKKHYFCAICDRKLNDVHLTDTELTERFKRLNYFTCNVCYQVYRNIKTLKDHQMEHFNGNDLKVACVECTNLAKKFDTVGTLDEVYTKNDVRLNAELLCEMCDRCFDDKNKYLRHIRDHFDRIVYECDKCDGMKTIGWER